MSAKPQGAPDCLTGSLRLSARRSPETTTGGAVGVGVGVSVAVGVSVRVAVAVALSGGTVEVESPSSTAPQAATPIRAKEKRADFSTPSILAEDGRDMG